ncbi:hypothetical protein ACFVGM_16955 [Kitasatospora purpeofusca]|uniref:glycine-rich domain-containing protein n=1 Tax=Kitasatospora purpeofusca TaxID=67352 RepID=UPI00368C3828
MFTFTVPPDVTGLHVDAWGAGGGSPFDSSRSGFGGGGGGYVHGGFTAVPGEQLVITVGAAGAAGDLDASGTTGGTTSVARDGVELMRADGGTGAGIYPGAPVGGVPPVLTDSGGGGVVRPGGGPGGTGNGRAGPGLVVPGDLRAPGCGDGGAGGSSIDGIEQVQPELPGSPGCPVISRS